MHTKQDITLFLEKKAYNFRMKSLEMTAQAGSGHPTSCLSAADIVAALFFYAMRFDASDFNNPNNDRFILSKGHAAPLLYIAWNELGKVSDVDLMTYRHFDSHFEGHPTTRFAYAEAATGSLGMGLSIGAGMALYAQRFGYTFKTFVLMGDSEISEGQIWEATQIAAFYKLHNLVGIVDCNRLGQSTEVMQDHHVNRYAQQFESFGWKTIVADGHDMQSLISAFDKALQEGDKPVMILAKTIKGYGVAEIEDKEGFHGKVFTKELPQYLASLHARFETIARRDEHAFDWQPHVPEVISKQPLESSVGVSFQHDRYKQGQLIATRQAFGQALAEAGRVCTAIVSLDAEVKNSTFAEYFEHAYPERFIQCFIAEQNMVSMAVGLAKRGAIPFVSTFGAFFSRAADQVRMAAIGDSPLRLVGSHAGVSIGEDGPSQMALEDIALMRAIPGSIVLYPSDAVSTYKMVELMLEYNQGISYLRTTRMATPVLYSGDTGFIIGGSKMIKNSAEDSVCVVAVGVTVFEALKAYDVLAKEGILICVIDAYSVKPLDVDGIKNGARLSSHVITVEDHYRAGGLGEAVAAALSGSGIKVYSLAVDDVPRSGKPQELLAWARIDVQAICALVRSLVKNR